jgi:hypothetical protein
MFFSFEMGVEMNVRSRFRAVVVFAVFALCSLAAAGAADSARAVVPPPGTPDLSQMVLQQSDFASTTITDVGYQPSTDFVAVYDRGFGPSTTTTGTTFLGAFSEANLASSAAQAQAFFGVLKGRLATSAGRKLIARQIASTVGKRVKPKRIHVGGLVNLTVGDGAFLLPISVPVSRLRIHVDFVALQRKEVVGVLVLMAIRSIPAADATALASAMSAHIDAVLSPQPPPQPVK